MPDDFGFRNDPESPTAPSSDTRPVIEITEGDLHLLVDQAEQALLDSGMPIFQRGRHLFRPATMEVLVADGKTTIAACLFQLNVPALLDMLARAARWTRYDGRRKKRVAVNPPKDVAEVLLTRFGHWRLPSIAGITSTPTLRPDRTILCEEGFDPTTRLYLATDPSFILPAIPAFPTRENALAALQSLEGLLGEFPFASPVDRAVALSGLLTPVCRGAMAVAPLHAIRANTPSSGKSFLVDVASAIATGRPCPVAAAGKSDGETDSRLVGLLLGGFPLISLDNVNGELGSELLCQAVERPIVRLRKLGGSDISEIETRATFFATGNAMRIGSDMPRRTLICDLDAQMERPEQRKFRMDPMKRVLADRGHYVGACLTIARGYAVSGAPAPTPPLNSYSDYDKTVRGALLWLGQLDPVLSIERAREDNPELGELRDVMTTWSRAIDGPKTTKQLREIAEADSQGYFNQALLAVASGRHGLDTHRLGKWLGSRRTHPYDPNR